MNNLKQTGCLSVLAHLKVAPVTTSLRSVCCEAQTNPSQTIVCCEAQTNPSQMIVDNDATCF